jgi:D-beta-D-heptose 7-phosphate kinase/D-beta-D-heptose 1-phosphate adenosyltransferase
LRLDRDGDRSRYAALEQSLLDRVLPEIDGQSAVVLADYEKGVITPRVAREVIGRCRRRGVPCIVDPKKADFSAYAEATVVTPNLMEAERAMGRPLPDDEAVGEAADQLRGRLKTDAMLITRGPEGMTLSAAGELHHVPSQTRDVADVTGAGDTVVAVLAACLGSGRPILESCRIANAAAGIAVSHPGTYVVQAAELEAAWNGLSPKILDRRAAQRRLAEARRRGRKVVFTNGCFDLLHAGHLACLEGAKRLGDLLVVGLNSDSSVRGLKGVARPVIDQSNRASLLAGLACVDLVVIFDEETPVSLIEMFQPDVLVKGSDYSLDQIAGADVVLRRGGQVVALPLVPGLSTTAILDRKVRARAS